jgi:antitoxin PrlF
LVVFVGQSVVVHSNTSAYSELSEKIKYSAVTVVTGGLFVTSEGKKGPCCASDMISCCKVESIVSVDERGQMVLPKEIREKAKIGAGDKLALVSTEKDGEICCLSLIKAEKLESMVKSMLGPVMDEVFKR